MRALGAADVTSIGLGAAILGSGGGGDPYLGELMALDALSRSGPIEVLDLEEVPDEALVVLTGMMGAPTVLVERPPGSTGQIEALEALSAFIGNEVTHVAAIEIGGTNSTLPLIAAARTGLPLIDADGMGRAFPQLQMVSPTLNGVRAAPMTLADDKGNIAIIESGSNHEVETEARDICIDMGASAFIAIYPMSGVEAKRSLIPGTLELARRIGDGLIEARRTGMRPVPHLIEALGGRLVFVGKVVSVDRRTEAGFARGEYVVEGSGGDAGSELVVAFQNENLLTWRDGMVEATVPDLISIVDEDDGRPVTTEEVRYGLRIAVLAIPSHPMWRTPEGLQLVGPRAFGYEVDFHSIG